VETLTAEQPAVAPSEAAAAPDTAQAAPAPAPDQLQAAAPAVRSCAGCGGALAPGQGWCLQCGAGAPGSLGTPGWRSAGAILGAAGVLALGAAAAGYAALSKSPRRAPVVTALAHTPPAAVPPPAVTAPVPTPTIKTPIPPLTTTPPKIPLTTPTPKATTTPTTSTPTTTTPSGAGTGGASGEEAKSTAILLDTNAATTYNPYNYAASGFGDPSLAIDGDPTTGWTAQVDPARAPRLAEGLLIDLKTPQRVAAVQIITSTPGMSIQIYGAVGSAAPTSITNHAWAKLTHSVVMHKRQLRMTLRESKHAFRFFTLWISAAPASAVGTPTAPGHVTVDELELFPAA
jgi:hypothetical protein